MAKRKTWPHIPVLLQFLLLFVTTSFYASGAKAKHDYLLAPDSASAPLIIEMNYLRNYSNVIKAKVDAQTELHKRRANHVTLKMQVKEQKIITDRLQGQIETLHKEKANLESNKTLLGMADLQPVFGGKQSCMCLKSDDLCIISRKY